MTKYLSVEKELAAKELVKKNWQDKKDRLEVIIEGTLLKEILMPGLDWLATLLQGAPAVAFLKKMQKGPQQEALLAMGRALATEKEALALLEIFAYFSPALLKEKLSRHYTWLFEGGNPRQTFLLYESAWLTQKLPMEKEEGDVTERETEDIPALALKQYLRYLGYRFDNRRKEPLDHLAFELSLLNLALKEGHYPISCELTSRIQAWITPLHHAIQKTYAQNHQKTNLNEEVEAGNKTELNEKVFYPLLFTLLTQLLKKLSLSLSSPTHLHHLSPNREVSYEKI